MPLRACRPSERQMWTGPDWDRPEVGDRGTSLGRPGCLISLQAQVPAVEAEAPDFILRLTKVGR